jgi:hypothetical protein
VSRSTRRRTAAVALSAGLLLSGCSALEGLVGGVEPERDAETGAIVESVRADAFALRVGDCLDLSSEPVGTEEEGTEFDSVPTTPCAEEHDSEIYAAHQLPDGDFPGDDAVATSADDLCYADFQSFVGTSYEESALDFTTFTPTLDSWELAGDREVLCVIADPSGMVTGTLRSAQR